MSRRKSKKEKKSLNVMVTLLTTALLIGSFVIAAVAIYVEPYAHVTMDISLLDLSREGEAAVLYACHPSRRREGNLQFYTPVGEVLDSPLSFDFVPYGEMPDHLVHAFVSIEDKRFFQHKGVDVIRTVQAAVAYVRGEGRAFGGSTITQQTIKNLTGEDDYTPERKLTEIFLALDTERHADKTEILECYLNIVNLSGGCRGVGAAAKHYFHKSVGELTVAESACLAAIINNPSVYDPVSHPENNRRRREVILSEMRSQGYIDEVTYQAAMREAVQPDPQRKEVTVSSWYADMVAADVIRDLQLRLGYSRARAVRTVYNGGVHIYTAMDPSLQSIVEDYYADDKHFPVGERGRPQSAMMIMDPDTGDILAVAGAVGVKQGNRVQNYATDTRRPAGSVIKPLSVYAPALRDRRITWSTAFQDAPVKTVNGRAWPRNADGRYRGRVTAAEALAQSLNTVAVQLVEDMGVERVFRFLKEDLHMDSLEGAEGSALHDQTVASMALGQQSRGVTVREITAAYTIFSDGIYRAPVSYHRVLDADGRVLLENRVQGEAVLDAANARLMTHMMETVVNDGTAKGLTMKREMGISVAGKTGTTQSNCDRWFMGYTPRLLAGVWMGYDYPAEMKGIRKNPCLRVWDEVIGACEAVYEGAPPLREFEDHPDLIQLSFCRDTGHLPTPACVSNGHADMVADGWFLRKTAPKIFCDHPDMEE